MIAQFALRMIVGMSFMWLVMPREKVTAGFFRIQMLVTLGLAALAGLTLSQLDDRMESASLLPVGVGIALCVVMAVLSYVGSILWTLVRRKAATVCVFLLFPLAVSVLLGSLLSSSLWETAASRLLPWSELSTSILLGGGVTTMLLGHWYLTAPTMSIAPLSRLNVYLGIAALLRGALSLASLLQFQQPESSTHVLWLWLRWGAGIIGPLLVVVMVWRILRYRNTQSATGVLFTGVILSFIGEMIGSLLYWETGIPY